MDNQHKTELNQQAAADTTGVEEMLTRFSAVEQDLVNVVIELEEKLKPYLVPNVEQQSEENYEMQSDRAQELQEKYRSFKSKVRRLQSIVERFDG